MTPSRSVDHESYVTPSPSVDHESYVTPSPSVDLSPKDSQDVNQEKKKVNLDLGLLFNPNNTIGIGGLTLRLSF